MASLASPSSYSSSPSAGASELISAIRAQSSTLNLLPLQRIDPDIQSVVLTAKHSVLYILDQQTEAWEREEVEGPFFLVERSSLPYYAMIILNRRSIDNFFQDIATDMTFEIQENYLFFQVEDDVIGVWFYEQAEALQAADALNKLVAKLQNPSFRPPPPSTPVPLPAPAPHPSTQPSKPRKAPPMIHTKAGKRLHRKAPPPPTLPLTTGIEGGDPRALERKLGDFLRAFDKADEQHRKAHEEEVQQTEAGLAAARAEGAARGGEQSIPLPLEALFRAAQEGALPPMPTPVTLGVKGVTTAQDLERTMQGRNGSADDGANTAPALHPLLSQMFRQQQQGDGVGGHDGHDWGPLLRPDALQGRGVERPAVGLLTPASLLAASSQGLSTSASWPQGLPFQAVQSVHLSFPLSQGLSFNDFRAAVQRLANDDRQLQLLYVEYSAQAHPPPP